MQSKRSYWASHISAWQSSGVSQQVYCHTHGLSAPSLHYWRRKLSGEVLAASQATPSVLPIQVKLDLPDTLAITLPNGITLSTPGSDDVLLGRLLRVLLAC